jgi:hypothetical protein
MRIHDHGAGPVDAVEDAPTVIGEDEEAAVGRIDVEPQPVGVDDLRDRGERIDRTRVRRSGRGDNEPGSKTGRGVRLDRRLERLGSHAPSLVEIDVSNDALGEPRDT